MVFHHPHRWVPTKDLHDLSFPRGLANVEAYTSLHTCAHILERSIQISNALIFHCQPTGELEKVMPWRRRKFCD